MADHEVTSADGARITVRVYHPDPASHGAGPYPVHLNFHGASLPLPPWRGLLCRLTCCVPQAAASCSEDLWSEAQLCLSMRKAGVVVVDVDYRLCPGADPPPPSVPARSRCC